LKYFIFLYYRQRPLINSRFGIICNYFHRIKVTKYFYPSKLTKSKRFCGAKITRNAKSETQTAKMEFI